MVNVKTDFSRLSRLLSLLVFLMGTIGTQSQMDFKSLEFNIVKENIFQRPITTMVMDKHGFLWIGTDGAGLYKFNGFSYTYYGHDLEDANSINSNSISSMFVDASGQLWVGTDAGLCVYNNQKKSFERFQNRHGGTSGNSYIDILCFAQYENRFLVGTYDGIKEVDVEGRTLKNYGLSGSSVLDLQFSTKGDLYIATDQGLKLEQNHQRGEIEHMSLTDQEMVPHITKLHLDKRENLWVGTLKSGSFRGDLKKARPPFYKLDIVERATMAIISGMNHVFMAIENEGLVILDLTGKVVKYYRYNAQDSHSISSDSVWSMLLDHENRLWLGYYENGLGFFDEHHNKFKSILRNGVGNSIQTNDIKAFAKTEDGKIWIAQINGIDILDTDTGDFTNVYGKSDSEYRGLPKGIYIEDVFVDSIGNIWIATWGNSVFLLKKGTKTF